jgi:hypothetical protein
MKVFITWSGALSHAVAKELHDWLPSVIQALKPFLSSEDIGSGERWERVLSSELEATSFGLVCLTKENRECHPWVQFEAGAIARVVEQNRVAVLLIDLALGEVREPLRLFQATTAGDKGRMEKLVMNMNTYAGSPVDAVRLKVQFDKYWPDFERSLTTALTAHTPGGAKAVAGKRTATELALEEVLSILKEQQQILRTSNRYFALRSVTLEKGMGDREEEEYIKTIGMLGGQFVQFSSPSGGGVTTIQWVGGPSETNMMAQHQQRLIKDTGGRLTGGRT